MTGPTLALLLAAAPDAEFLAGVEARGNAAAARPHFAAAAAGYDAAWEAGPRSPALALNRARAHLLADDLPGAVRACLDGLVETPADHELQRLLAECRDRVAYPTATDSAQRIRPDPPAGLRARVSPLDLFIAAAAASLLLTVGLARRLTARDRWATPVAAVGFIGLLAVASAAVVLSREPNRPVAVLVADALLRAGNGESYPSRLALPRGAEVVELGRRGGWVRVQLPGGVVGWLPEANLLVGAAPLPR